MINSKITNGVVGTNKLGNEVVTTAKLAKEDVTTDKVKNGAVTAAKLGAESAPSPARRSDSGQTLRGQFASAVAPSGAPIWTAQSVPVRRSPARRKRKSSTRPLRRRPTAPASPERRPEAGAAAGYLCVYVTEQGESRRQWRDRARRRV